MEKTFDIQKSVSAQKKYAEEKKAPHFAPMNGVCFRCKKQIYCKISERGHSLETASTELITGCPHCNYSFVD